MADVDSRPRRRVDAPGASGGSGEPRARATRTRARIPTRALLAIAALGLAVRVWYSLAVMHDRVLGYDALWYTTMAKNLADGRGFTVTFPLIPWHVYQPTAKFGPVWPGLLSVLPSLGGRTPTEMRIVGCVLGAVSVFLVGRLGTVLFERRVGLVAAGIAAVYPVFVIADGSLMTESLYLVLVLTLLNLLASGPSSLTWWRAAGLGALIGVAALTRGEGLFLLPFVLAPWALLRDRRHLGHAFAALGVAVLAMAAVMSPWLIRNEDTFHRLVLADDSALVIAGANLPSTYSGDLLGGWDAFGFKEYRPGFRQLDEAQRASIYQREGIDYATAHVSRLPLVGLTRLARTWGVTLGGQWRWEANETRPLGGVQAAWWSYLALLPFAIGAAWGLARARRLSVLLVGPVVMVSVIAVFTYGTQRNRYSAEPVVVILAAVAFVCLYDRWRSRSRSRSRAPHPEPASPEAV